LAQVIKGECIRPGTPLSLRDARRLVQGYVEHYKDVRLNSAIGYITPKDMLAGHQQEIQAERDRKLEAAREHEPPGKGGISAAHTLQ
jgi:putative transposase